MDNQRRDESSDPRLDDGTEADWASEGGALPQGPATDPDEDDIDPQGISLADDDVPEDR